MTDSSSGSYLNTISALAVSPDDTKLACHGWRSKLDDVNNTIGYVFLLRTDSGMTASKLLKMTHDQSYHVSSSGFLLHDSDIAMMAFNVKGNYNANTTKQRFYLAAVDLANNTMQWTKQSSDFHGSSAALIRTDSPSFPDIYAAGSYTKSSEAAADWDWAIVRITNAETSSPSFRLSVL